MPDTQELLALQRRRALADALLRSGMDSGPTRHPLEAIARMVQAYAGTQVGNEADTGMKNYETGMQADRTRALGEYMTKMQGQPAIPEPAPELGGGPGLPAQAPDPRGAMGALLGAKDPALQQAGLTQMLTQTKPDVFNKIDPKDYTPESIRAFQGAGNDFTKLVPVRKKAAVPLGGSTAFVDEYNPPASLPHTQSPDSVASNEQQRWSHQTPSGSAMFSARQPQLYTGGMGGPMWLPPPVQGGGGAPGAAPAAVPVQGPGGAPIQTTAGREDLDALRKEFAGLPEVKHYKEVSPIIASARKAADTPQGDINLIYAVGKVMDPGSVVREGELNLVLKSQSLQDKLGSYLATVTGGGRLTPHARKALMAELDTRVKEHEGLYERAKSTYGGIAQSRNYKPEDIFVDIAGTGGGGGGLSPAEQAELTDLRKRFRKS